MKTIILPASSPHRWLLERALPVIPLLLACFALSPTAQAVSPAPDGGYPGGDTAEGQSALLSIITGTYNTGVGFFSLLSDTTGNFNTAIGAGTLLANIADDNTATGAAALLSNTVGFNNTANGTDALASNTLGNDNTANGAFALFRNTTGSFNVALGYNALTSLTTGSNNVALGTDAGAFVNTGNSNIDIGNFGGEESATIRIGDPTIHVATFIAGINGVTITAPISAVVVNGDGQLGSIDIATLDAGLPGNNTAEGDGALINLTTGTDNTAMGFNALFSNTTGSANTATGMKHSITIEHSLPIMAMETRLSGSRRFSTTQQAHRTRPWAMEPGSMQLRDPITSISAQGWPVLLARVMPAISRASLAKPLLGGIPVLINSTNKLGTTTSSKRFKEDIKPMDKASEALFALKPVCFRYKKEIDPVGISQLGLVAEDVEKVNPDLVVRDTEGKPYTVRYDQVNAMLLNEFLKEHREVEELKTTVAEQRKGMEAMAAQLEEQAAQIQKVTAQLEASKPAPQVVNNP